MRILSLGTFDKRTVDAHGSRRLVVGAMGLTAEAHLVVAQLGAGGVIGRHPAAATQLLVVISGDAVVSGADDVPVEIGPGQAVVWERNEPHETRSQHGLVAMVVEGDLDIAER